MNNYLYPILQKSKVLFLLICLVFPIIGQVHAQADKTALHEKVQKAEEAAANSISFIENKGQWPANVLFRADIFGGQMVATPAGMLIGKFDPASLGARSKYDAQIEELSKKLTPEMIAEKLGPKPSLKGHGWRFNFIGGNLASPQSITKNGESKDYFNYLMGAGIADATNVHGYSELVYKNVYQGIDVRYYTASTGDLENDIVVHPGADSKLVKLRIEGIEKMKLNSDGSLVLPTTVGDITVPSPVSYLKDAQGNTTKIDVTYQLTGDNQLSFKIPEYDKSKTLVIDPIVMRWACWLTNTTGTSDGHNHGIEVNGNTGNIYTTGRIGTDMVTLGAFQTVDSSTNSGTNVFIAEYQEPATPGGAGTRVWQTYMGTEGSDNPYAMSLGTNNNLYITGLTSGNFQRRYGSGAPTSSWTTQRTCGTTIKQQAFVAEVSDSGTWALVREIGPATDNYTPQPYDIRVISTGASTFDLVVVATVIQQSNATDGDIPAAIIPAGTAKTGTGDVNGFVFRISSDLNTIDWAEQYTSSGNKNDGFNIANVDASGNIYIGGYTEGSTGISYNNPSGQTGLVGNADGWLMKLTGSTGAALWSRYFNAAAGDSLTILCMELNSNQTNLIMGGTTTGNASYNITTTTAYGGGGDFFVASVPATGAATNWGTYYGGKASEYNMMGLNVDQNNDIYVLGYTYSKNIHAVDFPVQDSSYNTTTNDRQAIFFKLSGSTGDTVLYSTYLGGSGDDYDPIGERGIKFSNCRIYLCMTAASNDFPLTAGTLTPTKTSGNTTLDPMLISMANPPDLQGNGFSAGANQTTTCGAAGLSQITAGTASYVIPTIIRNTTNETNGTKQAYPDGVPTITGYQWQVTTDTGTIWTNIAGATNMSYTPGTLTSTGLIEYRRIVDGDACTPVNDTVGIAFITVNPTSPAPTVSNNSPICSGQTLQLTADSVVGATYSWTGPNGYTSTLRTPTIVNATAAVAGVYQCTTITTSNGCPSYPSSTTVVITTQPSAPTASSNSPVCTGQTLKLYASPSSGATISWTGPNSYVSSLDSPTIANANSVNAGTYFVTQALGSCISTATSVTVVIDTIAAPTLVSASPNPLCSGQTLTLSATALGTDTLKWTFPGGGTTTGSPVVRTGVTTAMSGTYSVTQTSGSCVSNAVNISVTVNQTPGAPVVTAPDSVCAGSTLTLSATGVTGATFTWTYPGGGGTTGDPITRTGVTAAMGGTYTVTQTVGTCTSTTSGSATVVVNAVPVVSVGSTVSKYCSGGTLSLTSTVTGSSPFSYVWSGPDTFSRTQPNPTRTNTVPAMSGIYDLTVTDKYGCTANASTPFIPVNQSPSVSATANNTSFCTGGKINLTATPSLGAAPYIYSWTGPNGFISSLPTPSVNNVVPASAGIYTVTVTDTNGCTATGSTASLVVDTTPSVTASSLTPTYCSGGTISLSSTVTGGTPAYSYSWSGPGFTSGLPNPTIPNATTAMSGTYTLIVTDNHTCADTVSTSPIVVYQSPSITASSSSTSYCAGNTIVLTSAPLSGTTPYAYVWSGPASFVSHSQDTTRPNATTAMSGVYTVTVTDGHSCTASGSTNTITVNPGFTVNATSNSPVCAGGTLNLISSSTGGTAPFTYHWSATSFTSSSQDTSRSNASAAMAGIYSVTITDHNGCSNTATDTVIVNPATTINVTSNSPVCVGDSISLLATPNSGVSPFTYTWSGPSFSSSIANPGRPNANLSYGGTYFVTVSDHNGCSGTGSTVVVVNPLPAVTAAATSAGYCVSDTISLIATPSLGTPPYVTYTWSGPPAYSSSQQDPSIYPVTTAMAGTYTVTLTDSKGCSAQSSVSVAVYTNPVVLAGANQISCSGAPVTLGDTPTASGGNPGYTYLWNHGAAGTSNPTVNPTSTTTYTVTVTDTKTCSATASTTVTVNLNPIANAGANKTIPSCSLVGTTIGGNPTASGSTGPYTYLWSPATGLSSVDSSDPGVLGIGVTTPYTVTVTDHNGCTASAGVTVTIDQSTLASTVSASGTTAWCAAGSSSVTFTAHPTGGLGSYTYSWTGANLSSNNSVSTTANPSTAGTYTYIVIVKDSSGCQVSDTTSITVYPIPSANAGLTDTICHGDSVAIGGFPSGSGGTGTLTYAWNNSAASVSDPTVSPASTTTYTVTVTDANHCTATASTTVDVNTATTITVSSNSAVCVGNTLTLQATTLTGTGPFTYKWSGPVSFSASIYNPGRTNASLSYAGTYYVTVTDINGCSATDSTVVVVNPLPAVTAGATSAGYCVSDTISLTATPSLGTAPYVSYSWSGPPAYTSSQQDPSIYPVTTAMAGSYTVTVTDSKGCSAQGSVSVAVYTNPIVSSGANQISCSGAPVVLGDTPTASGGTPGYIYVWNNGAGNTSNPTVNPTSTTTYTVTVTDTKTCSATASTTITVNPNPTADAGADKTIPSCSLVGTSIGGSPTANGGTGPYTYLWAPAAGLSSSDTSNPAVHGIGSTTTYTVTVTDSNGCTANDAVTINVTGSSLSLTIAANGPTAWCASGTSSVTLTANPTGGLGGYTYAWTGSNLSLTDSASTIANPSVAGTYIYDLIVTDSTGCQAGDTASITVYTIPSASAGSPTFAVCNGDSVQIGGNPTGNGGTGTLSYTWNNGASPVADPYVSPTSDTTYTVTVTDANSCTATASTAVTVNPATTMTVSSNSAICVGDSLALLVTPVTGTGPFNYTWSGPAAFSSTLPNPGIGNAGLSNAGTYYVTVSDHNGCSGTGSTVVVVNPLPAVTAAATSAGYCVSDTISLIATPSLGTPPYVTYTWSGPPAYSSSQQDPSIYPVTTAMAGTYTVTLTDSKGCSAQSSVSVAVYTNPVVLAGANQISCSGAPVTLGDTPTASGGNPGYTYLWNHGAAGTSNPTVNPTSTTTYTVTVTDTKTCSATASTTVTVNLNPIANAGANKTIPSCSLVGTTIGGNPTASGSTGPYTYLWSPATGLSSVDSSDPGVLGIGVTTPYTVTVTDHNGCTASAGVTVTIDQSTLASTVSASGTTAWCAAGSSSVTFTAHPTGGLGSYTYSWTGANLSSNNSVSTTANPSTAGTYTYIVIVKDSSGCQVSDTTSITVYPIPSANAGLTDTICHGDSVAIGGFPSGSGGTGTLTYAWNNSAASVSDPTVSPASTTTYTVTVTDANHCTATASTTVDIRSNPVANAGPNVNLPGCSPTGIQIGGSPTGSGGAGGTYTYAWSPPNGLSSTTIANPIVQGITSDQTYTVTVTDSNGCSSSAQVSVHVTSNPPSVSIFAGGATSWCAGSGDSVFLAASVTGGTGTITYAWSGTSISPLNAPTAIADPSTANTYTYGVTVTDAFNCTATATKTITVNANPTANAGSANYTICHGDTVTIGGNPTATGGDSIYTYSWSNGVSSIANPMVNPDSTTTYTVTVSDGNSCKATASSTVTVRPDPIANAGANKSMPSCTPTGLPIGGNPTASGGGGGPYTYAWSPSTGLSSTSVSNPTVVGLTSDTTYTVTVTDVNGCSASAQMTITITNNTPSVNISASGNTSWCAGTNSSVNLTANTSGGSGQLTYSWSGADINPVNSQLTTVYPNSAGTFNYEVTVTDTFNCTATASKTITVNSIPTVSAGPAIENICSGSSVTIGGNPTASGGLGTYTYAWSGGANNVSNPSVNPTNSTTYIVTVTDSVGCTATASTTVLVRPTITVNAGIGQTISACPNSCVTLGGTPTASGGSGSLTYAWSPPTGLSSTTSANPVACGLSGDTIYTVTVTDTAGCTATGQISIRAIPSSLTAEAGTGGSLCLGSGDSVMLGGFPTAVGGTPAYTYTWSPTTGLNLVDPANPVANPTVTTLYHLTVTDAQGCTSIDSSQVRVFQSIQVQAGNDTTVCQGSSVIIGGNPTASGGNSGTYTYVWSPATNISSITVSNPTTTPFNTTTYTVTATDGNGCSATSNVIINTRPSPIAQAGSDQSMNNCSLDSVLLGGSPSASGGTGSYIYAWSPPTGLNSTSVPNPIVTGISGSQTYTLLVTDSLGCYSSDNVVISVVPSTLQAFQPTSEHLCGGPSSCVQLGSLPTAIGGVSPYTYSWSGTLSNPTSSNPIACPTGNVVYDVTITDSKGCTVTSSESVFVLPTVVVNAGNDTAVCLGQPVVIGGNPTASGGVGTYTYSWTPPIGISSSLIANPVANPTATTTYTVVVSDSNGCSATGNVIVTVRPLPTADAGPQQTISICSNDSVEIGNIPVATGGTPPYTYLWTPAAGLSSQTVPNPIVSGITQTTPYQILVTDTFGCTATSSVIVKVTQSTLQAQAGSVNVICASANTPVTIGGFPTATGGTPPYVYNWGPSTGLSSTSVPNPIATVSSTTTYYVTVTDSKGCVSVDSVKINQLPSPTANAGRDTALCLGFGDLLGGNPTASGGTGSYQYSWTPTIGLNANNTSNPSAYPLTTTTYQVVVTDSNGCQAADAVTITIHQNPSANAGANMTITSCVGDTAQLGGTPTASGGAGGYTYIWSPATGLSSDSVSNPFVTGISSSTVYELTVTDANGCSAVSSALVNIIRSTLSANAGNDANICAGNNTIVTLGGSPTSQGGTGPYTYTWAPGSSLNATDLSNPFATPTATTGYNVTVTDSKGCTASDSVTVFVNPSPSVNAGIDTTVCSGNSVRVGGNPTASGAVTPYSYSWSPTIGVSNVTASNPLVTPVATTTYSVLVTDAHGCTGSNAVTITVHQAPTANAGPDESLVACNADSVRIGGSPSASGGTGPYTYLWSPPTGVSSDSVPNPYVSHLGSSATFTLVVTDSFGCSASDQVNIAVTGSTLFANAGNNVTVCQGASGLVILGGTPTASGGAGGYTYAWSPATGLSSTTSPNPAALPGQSTEYTLVVTDAAGCKATDTVDFTINPKPVVSAGSNDTICQGMCVTLGGAPTADGNPATNVYSWSPSLTLNNPSIANPTACPTVNTSYSVTVTNQYNCSSSSSMIVKVNATPVVNAGTAQSFVSCPNTCVTLGGSPTATGGQPPYNYNWSPTLGVDSTGLSNPSACGLRTTTTFTVTVTDANGCSASGGVLIQTVPSTLAADAGPDKSICAGQNNCITIGGSPAVTGGSSPYIIQWSPGAYFCGSATIANPQVNPSNTTVYTLLVTDANGCTATDSTVVIANPAVTAIVNPDTDVCSGSPAILGGFPSTGSGGTPPYTYAWTPTIGISSPGSGNPIVTTLTTTTYCVKVTDSVGCSTSACQAVIVSSPMTANAGPAKILTGCPNASVTIGGFPAVIGGSGSYSYSWTPATGLDSTNVPNPVVRNLGTTTVYTLVVTDLHTGCSATAQVQVTVDSSTLAVNAGSAQFLCYDNRAGVQIGGIPTASGGQGPYTYTWSPALGLSSTSAANPIALPSSSTTYVVSVSDALGCVLSDSVLVTVVQHIPITISGLNTSYCLNASNVIMTATPSGGTFSGPGVAGNTFQPSVIGVGNWCIKYTYNDPVSGCSSDTTVCVVVDSLPKLTISGYNPSYCHLDSAVTLIGSPSGGTFSGPGISGNIFTPANALSGINIITYTYTDTLFGCSNSTQFAITINNVPTMTIAASDSVVCPGSNVSLSAQYSTDVFNIVWSNGTGTSIYSGLNAFTVNPSVANNCYIATAVNNAGCTTRDTLCLQLLDCYINAIDEPCEADSVVMNTPITVHVLDIDTLPSIGTDTTISIQANPVSGTVVVNSDHTITYTPTADFSGNVSFVYQVCVTIKGYPSCDTADVCITVVDTTVNCNFPNTITPNNDGINDEFAISCNDEYPNSEIRIYDRWGAEVYRMSHYDNKWSGYNQQGIRVPDGTYFYMYYFNNGSNKMKAGFVDVYR